MKLIIAGKRDFNDKEFVYKEIDEYISVIGKPSEIIEGGASGVDSIAIEYGILHKIPIKTFFADWDTHGRAAGPIRNEQMAKYASKNGDGHLLAFWDGQSRGTKSMIEQAKKYKLKYKIIQI